MSEAYAFQANVDCDLCSKRDIVVECSADVKTELCVYLVGGVLYSLFTAL